MANSEGNKGSKQVANFAKYIGIAFQMLSTIGILSFIGYKMDEYKQTTTFVFTAIFGIVGVVISLISVIRSLNKGNNEK